MNGMPSFAPKHILCPVDFSELSDLALKYAAVAARQYGARLTVLHAETFELPRYFSASQSEKLTQEMTRAKKAIQRDLAKNTRKILGPSETGLNLKYEVVEAHPVQAILEAAEKESSGLIVIGTHGKGGFKSIFLGSVTQNVVRNARNPVFVVRQKEHEFIDVGLTSFSPRLERILCPVNMTEWARRSVEVASSLATQFHSQLTVLYTLEPREQGDPSEAIGRLKRWLSNEARVPSDWKAVVRQGHAAEQTISYAKEEKDDLIVLAAQHKPFLQATFFGETTELVLRHAPVPVLMTPHFPVRS
jgi:nucleotide-binding universal stress UspA family protein